MVLKLINLTCQLMKSRMAWEMTLGPTVGGYLTGLTEGIGLGLVLYTKVEASWAQAFICLWFLIVCHMPNSLMFLPAWLLRRDELYPLGQNKPFLKFAVSLFFPLWYACVQGWEYSRELTQMINFL